MMTKSLARILIVTLLCSYMVMPRAYVGSQEKKALKNEARVKEEIAKLGTGPDARIAVKLRNKTTVAGYVSQVGDDSFVVTDLKTSATTTVPYLNVEQAEGKGFRPVPRSLLGLV